MIRIFIKVGRLIKPLIPPLLWMFLRKVVSYNNSNKVFDGIYDSLNDVPESNYNNVDSLDEMFNETSNKLQLYKDSTSWQSNGLSPISNLLPLLIALASDEKKITVLDFGGGMGDSYLNSLSALEGSNIDVEFHVIDLEATIEFGMKIFPKDMGIHFHTSVNDVTPAVDIIYIGSTLQYVNDYQTLIQKFVKLSPKYIFLTDNFMGEIETFATTQVNMKDRQIAYWIFKLSEIIDLMAKNGYKKIYMTKNHQPFHNFNNFSDEYKIDDSSNLLFSRNE
jgi:putative methyltransferase (TIGR04325 family)